MHCYRCGRRVPDRSPRCENCGQKFNYGNGPAPAKAPAAFAPASAPAVVVPPPSSDSAIVPPAPPESGLSESIFEVSRSSAPSGPASAALHEATAQAVIGFGEAIPIAEPTDPDGDAGAAASAAVPRADQTVAVPPEVVAERAAAEAPAEPAPVVDEIRIGKTLSGRLEIVAELGGGPLGRVFKAVDRKKGSVVAVKAIPAASLPEAALSGRFAETIALVKSLVHPNLIKVYGAGREGDTAFTIEQYLEGLPLRALLDVKRENSSYFTFEEAEPVVAQICQGLSFAHASLVHGGLKPENVIIHVDSLKIVDLGLSRLFSPIEWCTLQRSGKNAGAYLAPEYGDAGPNDDGSVIDRRADVYSVGAILYEMLTGRAPTGPDAPPVSRLNPSVPRAVDRVVAKAMARRPSDRYESAADLKEAVLRVLGGDILAEDLESPVGELMETFVDDVEPENEPGIEIEYLEPGPLRAPQDDREAEATPVGAITVHEPLWEPDEIAESRTKSDSKSRKPIGIVEPEPEPEPPATPGAAVARELFEPVKDPAAKPGGARSSVAPTAIASSRVFESTNSGLGARDHISVEIPVEELSASSEATAAGSGPAAGPPPRPADWLDVSVEVPPTTTGIGAGGPPPRARASSEREFPFEEGSPLELELRSEAPAPVPESEAPTTRLPQPTLDAPRPPEPLAPRRPSPTPAPWDGRAELDRPTDPPRSSPDRPTAPVRPRVDDNPGARALSPPQPPPLDLPRTGGTGGGAREQDRPTADAPRPIVRAPDPPFASFGGASARARNYERPTLDVPTSPPRPTFVVRREKTRAPIFLAFFVLLAGGLGGGGWYYSQHPDVFSSFLPIPKKVECPAGMTWFAPGLFEVGSDKLDPDRDVTEPILHKEQTDGFCIDKFEFPNKEDAAPLVNVTVLQAETACAKEGKRLCTEDEWERACKGPSSFRFPYGDKYAPGLCNVGTSDAPGTPRAAGTFPQCGRDDGIRDMSGNVWELTSTPWGTDDPSARVIKGGSAKLPPWGARCSYRDSADANKSADDIGFRCCMKPG